MNEDQHEDLIVNFLIVSIENIQMSTIQFRICQLINYNIFQIQMFNFP